VRFMSRGVKKIKSPIADGIKLPLTSIEPMTINVMLPNGPVSHIIGRITYNSVLVVDCLYCLWRNVISPFYLQIVR
jgi:hypothetical protein